MIAPVGFHSSVGGRFFRGRKQKRVMPGGRDAKIRCRLARMLFVCARLPQVVSSVVWRHQPRILMKAVVLVTNDAH